MKKLIGVLLVAVGMCESVLLNVLSSDRTVTEWAAHNRALVLTLTAVVLIAGIWVSFLSEARKDGDPRQDTRVGSVLGGMVSTGLVWGVAGAVIGFLMDSQFKGLLAFLSKDPQVFAVHLYLVEHGALTTSCLLSGAFAGTNLRYVYRDPSGFLLAVVGAAVGGISGVASAPYFVGISLGDMPVGRVTIAAACTGLAWGLFTGIFKSGHDERGSALDRHQKEQEAELAKKKELVGSTSARVEVASVRLARHGYKVVPENWLTTMADVYLPKGEANPPYDVTTLARLAGTISEPTSWVVTAGDNGEIQRFSTVEGIEAFANQLESGPKT